jgi:hypothetical protein
MLLSLSAIEMLVIGFVAKIAPREESVFSIWYLACGLPVDVAA